jgi:hypothetical protein
VAYGKGKQNVQRRSLPGGKTMLVSGIVPSGKRAQLLALRDNYIAAANAFVDAVFLEEPLAVARNNEDIHKTLSGLQKAMAKGFNKAYVEKARLAVPSAIAQVEEKYLKRLYGRLLHCAAETHEKDPAKRQYLNIPVTIQHKITREMLEALEQKSGKLGFDGAIDLFRQVVIRKSARGLTSKEAMVVRAIHDECLGKYQKPVFGMDGRYACQINLDYRVVRNRKEPVGELDMGARLLVDRGNRKFYHFLEISNPVPFAEPIRVPVVMSSSTLKRFDKLSSVSSLAVIIEPDSVSVRAVIAKPDTTADVAGVTHLIGRDFGMVNTVSLSVVKLDDPVDPEKLKRIAKFTHDEALSYLTSYSHPDTNIVERVRFSGRNFLDGINRYCERIDRLKSQIDTGYNNLARLKEIMCGYLGIGEHELFSEEDGFDDPYITAIHAKFFRLYKHIVRMKQIRLNLYKKISSVKRVWFGFLSNQEARLARKYSAAVVREDLGILAKEKKSSGYKGRTFNKTINNGSKGQYIKRASDKLRWDGIPEIVIPSYYTSTTCTVHSLVDDAMRQGEQFCCPQCKIRHNADEHAADTIGKYILLRPVSAQQVTLHLPRARHSARNLLIGSPNQ